MTKIDIDTKMNDRDFDKMSQTSIISNNSITTVDWSRMETYSSTSPRSKRIRALPLPNNEVFRYMTTITADPFWVQRMTEAKEGHFPSKISYANGILQYKTPNDTFSIEINPDVNNPEELMEAAQNFINFYKLHLHIHSPTDYAIQEENVFENNINELEGVLPWSKIKKKQAAVILVEFADSETVEKKLTQKERKQLMQTIHLATILKYINNETVVVEDGKIVEQDFLIWDTEKRIYKLNDGAYRPAIPKTIRKVNSKREATFAEKWATHRESAHLVSKQRQHRFYAYPKTDVDNESSSMSDIIS